MNAEAEGGRSAADLEALWSGEFGEAWVERNRREFEARGPFWRTLISSYPATSILEVGAAHGENLRHLSAFLAPEHLWALDVNPAALAAIHEVAPGVNTGWGRARSLPFRDGYFDMVLTVGLLIHQPEDTLPLVMNEIVRCSRRFVVCGEYHSDEPTTIRYRDLDGVLFKRDFGRMYLDLFPELRLREERFLTLDADGFDRVTLHVFEKGA